MKIKEGDKILNYKIIKELGKGGMGIVYLAQDLLLNRKVAIKMLNPFLISDNEILERFKNEAKVQAQLIHPNIVTIFNFFEYDDNYFMVMEYVDGETLAQRIKKVGLLLPHKSIPIFLQILNAVSYTHKKGILHRDLKPSNILINKYDSIKVVDFGIAKLFGDKGLSRIGIKLGTISYMSPEQILGEKDIDKRSGIYSLGITFFEILTGHLPYQTETESDFNIMQQIVNNELPSVKKYYPYIPDRIEQSIRIATNKEREKRFQNCDEFISYIENEEIPEQEYAEKRRITYPVEMNSNQTHSEYQPLEIIPAEIKFRKAKLGSRFLAHIIDILVFTPPIVLFSSLEQDVENAVGFVVLILLFFVLYMMKDGFRQGKGVGKGAMGLRLIKLNGEPISKGISFLRTLIILIIYSSSFGFIIDIGFILIDKKGQRMVDKMFNLMVVEENDYLNFLSSRNNK